MKTPPFNSLHKDILLTLALAVVALVVVSGSGVVVWDTDFLPDVNEEAEIAMLKERYIIEYVTEGEDASSIVQYAYRGEKLPEKLTPDEVTGRRTEMSYTRLLGIENEGTSEEKLILKTMSYSQSTFIQRDGAWYYIEYDSTPKKYFDGAGKSRPLSLVSTVHAATISPFSHAGDGEVDGSDTVFPITWDGAHDLTNGATADYTGTAITVSSYIDVDKILFANVDRGFVPFDTSSIPSGSTVTAVTLTVTVSGTPTNFDNDGLDYVTVVQTSQATHSQLVTEDFDQCGSISSPTEGIDSGQRKDITSGVSGNDFVFTLNATGRDWIKTAGQSSSCSATSGISCFGLREGHDTTNTAPDNQSGNTIVFASSETSGTGDDPVLSVTYTLPKSAFWQFQDF